MPESVVQLVRDAQALGHAAGIGEDLLHRAQLAVRVLERGPRRDFAGHEMESEEGHQLETEIRRRQQEGGARIERDSHRSGQQHRLDRDPRQACAPVELGPQLHRNHRQQGSLVAVAPEHHQHQRGR